MDPEIKVTSVPENLEIEVTTHTENLKIEVTSATEDLGIKAASAAQDREIEVASDEEDSEIEVASSEEQQDIKVTSVAANQEIEVISAAEDLEGEERNFWFNFDAQKGSIFRVPSHIRDEYGWYFKPQLVSIGPYSHGRKNLKLMQDLKLQCMSDLGKNQKVGGRNINDVPVDPFMRFERYARPFYQEDQKFDHSPVDFVRILVLDSCFIIRVILHEIMGLLPEQILLTNMKNIRSDLLLLHNQIPLFFIERVYYWFFSRKDNPEFPSFHTVLEPFICMDMSWRINHGGNPEQAAHLLDLYWRWSSPPRHHREQEQPSLAEFHLGRSKERKLIANAVVLHQMAAIRFEKLNNNDPGLNVIFSNGIIRMPCLMIDSSLPAIIANLVAFEKSKLPTMRTFSSYMKIMNELINSEDDVLLLQNCGVIANTLRSHTMATTFFNDIASFCFIDFNDHRLASYVNLLRDVQKYYNSNWNRRYANLVKNYFGNPWAAISVIAGMMLYILVAIQTFYTLYDHYNRKN